jgi:hypothetical protein
MQHETNKEQNEKLLKLLKEAVQHEATLRNQYQMGEKFRFIRDRLQALMLQVESQISELEKKTEQKKDIIADNEMVVYVHLFNAQGILLQTWLKMLNASVFYDHSVNRPIYIDKAHIEEFIRSKANKVQHAYLAVAVPKQARMSAEGDESLKDTMGHPLIKIKEGSLQINRLLSFTHNNHDYVLTENGSLTKKLA